ncbi:MAG: hypothetical protein DWG79_00500 [Chloroflexi bacterium]|nr:hypothetical protein [Chloroflexota bacterium]MDA1148110.1 hypothetical protein [Chloroflexota bacterium]MQC82338.1 hypothetical protein [Chloroflexota bacterium]
MSNDVFVTSLRNRIRAMNRLWEMAASDLTLDQINHHERNGVIPMAFSFAHFIKIQDGSISMQFLGAPPLWAVGGWAEKTGVTVNSIGREETVQEMEQIRFGDIDAWREYQSQVLARTETALVDLTEERLLEVVSAGLGESMKNSYCAIVLGGVDTPVRKLEVLECFVYQHGLRHMGEVELGRALVGLGGMTS